MFVVELKKIMRLIAKETNVDVGNFIDNKSNVSSNEQSKRPPNNNNNNNSNNNNNNNNKPNANKNISTCIPKISGVNL